MEIKGNDGVVTGWRKLELPKTETKLSPGYEKTLSEIKIVAPRGFYESAVQCAQIFNNLDQGNIGLTEKKFAEELAQLPSIKGINNLQKLGGISFEEATPKWLHDQKIEKNEGQCIPQIAEFYKSYIDKKATRIHQESNGTYVEYDEENCPTMGEKILDHFKAYIETDCAHDKMENLFEELATEKSHPHTSKLFEGSRLVLYWRSQLSPELEEKIKNIFDKNEVKFRGFAQDAFKIDIEINGAQEILGSASSDQTRGEGGKGAEFYKHKYNPEKFFKMYIGQMFRYGRNPLDPYKNIFVPMIGDINKVTDKEKTFDLVKKIQERALEVKRFENQRDLFLFR